MRPLSLQLTAFGPFAGEQTIDFNALGAERVFLICGPTGAGKSSLLDAMCYALYGESSGAEREAQHLRCRHAPTDARCGVEFTFRHQNRVWRVRRQPAHERTTRTGSTTAVPESATLWLDDAPPIGKLREVNARIADGLGLSAAEFRQVALLPQGRFREVLTAKGEHRQAILGKLFGTALYQRVADALAATASEARLVSRDARTRREALLGQTGAADLAAAAAARDALAAVLVIAEASRDATISVANMAAVALAQGRADAALLATRDTAVARHAAVGARAPAIAAARQTLQGARRADQAGMALAAADAAAQAAREAASRAGADVSALSAAALRAERATHALADVTAREAAIAAARSEADRLADAARRIAAAEVARQALDVATDALADASVALAAAEAALDAQLVAAAKLTSEHAVLETIAAAEPLHRLARDAAAARLADHDALANAQAQFAAAARRSVDLAAAADGAAAKLAEAREIREAAAQALARDHAAAFAHTLVPGEPCPVCGSAVHPHPAMPEADGVPDVAAAEAAERRVAEAHEAARGRAAAAATQLAVAEGAVAGARDRLAGDPRSRAAMAAGLMEANAAFAAASDAITALPASRRAEQRGVAAVTTATMARDGARIAEAAAAQRLASAQATHAERLAQVPPGATDADLLRAGAERAAASSAAQQQVLDADRAEAAAAGASRDVLALQADTSRTLADGKREAAASAEAMLVAACAAAGFEDAAALRDARRDHATQAALEGEIARFDGDYAGAAAELARAEAAAAGLAVPALDALERAAHEAAAARDAAIDAAAAARRDLEASDALLGALRVADAALLEAEAEESRAVDLHKLASGQETGLDFEGFVLTTLLDEALAAANRHLSGMLGGRFAVRRRVGRERGQRGAGLDIEVMDAWNNEPRAAATLSGGEGFCASLALALGLADTVAAHAGARQLGALFIDEGFGTLDPATLDTAMGVIEGLAASDRLVGLISHVGDLRDRVAAKLEVIPGRAGSRASFRFG